MENGAEKRVFRAAGRTVTVYPAAEPGRPAVYLNTFADEGGRARELLRGEDFTLAVIGDLDWDRDMKKLLKGTGIALLAALILFLLSLVVYFFNLDMSPQNKQDRRQLLLLLLTDADGLQKLYYFAQTLGVSEATVSTDLDGLEEYCAVFGLRLARRQSQGVELTGGERALRRLAVDVVCRIPDVRSFSANYGYPSLRVMDEVQKTLQGEWAPKLDWMTEESLAMLTLQLTVMVERVRRGHTLEQGETPAAAGLPRQLAGQLCDSLESRFSVSLPDGERSEVALFIRACRAKHLNPLDINDAAVYRQMQNMVSHICGIDAVAETVAMLPQLRAGKIVSYPNLHLPLTAIADFEKLGRTDPMRSR